MVDKIYDNAKLTKLINKLINKKEPIQKTKYTPNLIHFTMFSEYNLPLPAGKITAIRTFTTLQQDIDDKDKKELSLDFRYREAGQLTTKTVDINEGLSKTSMLVNISSDNLKFIFDLVKIKSISVTITYVPFEKIEE